MQTGDKHTKVGNIMFTQNDVQARKLQHATGTVLWKKTPGWQKMPPLQFSGANYFDTGTIKQQMLALISREMYLAYHILNDHSENEFSQWPALGTNVCLSTSKAN